MTAVAPGLFYRHLTVAEVLARSRKRHVAEIARHNLAVLPDLERTPATRDQVLAEFPAATRRWLR